MSTKPTGHVDAFFAFFGKRKSDPEPPTPAWWESEWRIVRAEYEIGRRFSYLGRIMTVAKYGWRWNHDYSTTPTLVCDYADDTGVLHQREFTVEELPLLTLLAKNARL